MEIPYGCEAVPGKETAAPDAGEPETFCPGPLVTMAGLIGNDVVVALAPTVNCCGMPVDCLVSGCTRKTPAMVKTSPCAGAPVPVFTVRVAPDCPAPLTR